MSDQESPRVGVYVCHCGGNISDVVDVEKVVEEIGKLEHVAIARHYMFMCSDPGQNLIEEDIEKEKLDRVVVAACAPNLHELTFRTVLARVGTNPYLYDHANIREQVSWVTKSDHEGATDKAIRLVAAAVAKAVLQRPLEPLKVDAKKHVAVIGGGVAGLTSARDLARRGFSVTLVEKSGALGGRVMDLGRVFPTEQNAREMIRGLIDEVESHPHIEIHTRAEVIAAAGSAGSFRLTVRTWEGEPVIEAGAIILATGFDPYSPREGEFGFGKHPGVITLPDLARFLDAEGPTGGKLPENGHPVKNVCMIHCVGSRQVEGIHEPGPDGKLNGHCSRTCCTATLRAANEIRERFPDVNVFDVCEDIRTYGHGHENYYENATRGGVLFFRHRSEDPPEVLLEEGNGASPLTVKVKDTLTFDEEVLIPADLVVLATGMVPRNIDGLVEILKLPRSPDGFLQEVHPKLRPVELAVEGVFVAGTCQAPMDIVESCAAASAAAVKAAAMLAKGYLELDPFVAEIDPDLCDGCGLCLPECKYTNALTAGEGEGAVPLIDAAKCSGCGMCASVCPTGALNVRGWRTAQYDAMVDAILAGDAVAEGAR